MSDTGGDPGDGATEIRKLDPTTVERIAAGEVVERPASVVKELVENGLDAGAGRIEVGIDGDGTDRLRVRDDGQGMTEADARASVREHTTSKIDDVSDLEAGVATLGFRGEALHTIGAVSRTTITTRPPDGDVGTRLRYEGGEVVTVEPAGHPGGTTVEVEDLFYNTPARRKYLKSEATEFAHVNRVVSRYALANPGVAVSLEHDGRETFSTTGANDLRAAILAVYGREVAEATVPVTAGGPVAAGDDVPPPGEDLADGPLEGIGGYVTHPETTRSSGEYVSTFVNGRYVRASTVRDAVVAAYGGQLASDRYPFAVLHLELDPGTVDVNVHPRKMEVRFDDEDGLRRQVRAAVRSALLDHGLERSAAPRGRSAPDETPVEPGTGESDGGDADIGPLQSADGPETGGRRDEDGVEAEVAGPDDVPEPESRETDDGSRAGSATEGAGVDPGESGSGDGPEAGGTRSGDGPEAGVPGSGTASGARTPGSDDGPEAGGFDDAGGPETGGDGGSPRSIDGPETGGRTEEGTGAPGAEPPTDPARKFEGPTDQHTLDGDRASPGGEYDRLPSLRVLGQVDDTYVVAESPDGLVLIDQHAADERIHYEQLRREVGQGTAQGLAAPVEVELTAGEAATFEAARDALSELGFRGDLEGDDGDDPGSRTLRVTAVPAVVGETIDPDRLRDVLATVVTGDPADTVRGLRETFLADLACRPAITGNTSLTEGSVTDLLAALDRCNNPYSCPHGRPVVLEIDGEEIEERFERDYPGHGG